MRYSLPENGVPEARWRRVGAIVHFANYAEQMVGGVLTGGATLEEINEWRRLGFIDWSEHEDVTEAEMRELEGYGMATLDGAIWRVRPKPSESSESRPRLDIRG